jgi:putative ABC transport system permease protein
MIGLGGETLGRMSNNLLAILVFGILVALCKAALDWFMRTEIGLALRATGDNPQMIRALGANTDQMIILGLALSNGLVGLSGALIAQYQGFADVNMGIGLIIAGLAAVILGETLFRPAHFATASTAVILGMILYRVAIAAALTISIPLPSGGSFTIDAQDVKLATAVLVFVALWFTHIQNRR